MTVAKMTVAERIKLARNNAGISQKSLGAMIGVSQQAIGNYESGYREPTILHIVKLSKALGVSADWICGNESDDELNAFTVLFNSLNSDGRRALMLQAEFFASRPEYKRSADEDARVG